jgi:hypothetical protein
MLGRISSGRSWLLWIVIFLCVYGLTASYRSIGDNNDAYRYRVRPQQQRTNALDHGLPQHGRVGTTAEKAAAVADDDSDASLPALSRTRFPAATAYDGDKQYEVSADQLRGLTVFSMDFHISPVKDLKDVFSQWGIKFIDQSLSGACGKFEPKTCAQDLKVVTRGNGFTIDNLEALRSAFFDAYKNNPIMKKVDMFHCSHPSSMCEMFMPFNKTLLVFSTTRMETGRGRPALWRRWVKNVRRISLDARNVVAANSVYDAEYTRYFTGVDTIFVPSYCGYIPARYRPLPDKKVVLVSSMHHAGATRYGWDKMDAWLKKAATATGITSVELKGMKDVYRGHYEYQDIASHPAIIHMPYQVSVMSGFEWYRMGIPMFVPSLDMLTKLQVDWSLLNERSWPMIHGRGKLSRSDIEPHYDYVERDNVGGKAHAAGGQPFDPNNEKHADAIKYWLSYSDFYHWPHVQYFDSWEHLLQMLGGSASERVDLAAVSAGMMEYNRKLKQQLNHQWRLLFDRMFAGRPTGGRITPSHYQTAMRDLYP